MLRLADIIIFSTVDSLETVSNWAHYSRYIRIMSKVLESPIYFIFLYKWETS